MVRTGGVGAVPAVLEILVAAIAGYAVYAGTATKYKRLKIDKQSAISSLGFEQLIVQL